MFPSCRAHFTVQLHNLDFFSDRNGETADEGANSDKSKLILFVDLISVWTAPCTSDMGPTICLHTPNRSQCSNRIAMMVIKKNQSQIMTLFNIYAIQSFQLVVAAGDCRYILPRSTVYHLLSCVANLKLIFDLSPSHRHRNSVRSFPCSMIWLFSWPSLCYSSMSILPACRVHLYVIQ